MGEPARGTYFSKTSYARTALAIAFRIFNEPARGNALVSQFIDPAAHPLAPGSGGNAVFTV